MHSKHGSIVIDADVLGQDASEHDLHAGNYKCSCVVSAIYVLMLMYVLESWD
jgi:hypothetical protein